MIYDDKIVSWWVADKYSTDEESKQDLSVEWTLLVLLKAASVSLIEGVDIVLSFSL